MQLSLSSLYPLVPYTFTCRTFQLQLHTTEQRHSFSSLTLFYCGSITQQLSRLCSALSSTQLKLELKLLVLHTFFSNAVGHRITVPGAKTKTDTIYHSSMEKHLTFHSSGFIPPFLSNYCLLYTSPSPRDATLSRMPSSA